MIHRFLPGAVLAIAAMLLAASTAVAAQSGNPAGRPLIVFAAASLKEALDAIGAAWRETTGQVVRVSHAGTSALARQIELGAPADVFISADPDWMAYLAERRLVEEPRILLANRLVLVAPRDAAASLPAEPGAALLAALGDGRLAVANVESVPAGRYARAALQSLGLWPRLAGSLVQTADVRAALRLVARGEVPLGIVYATDALAEPRVRVVAMFEQSTHPAILYLAAVVGGSPHPQAAAFLDFLATRPARVCFEREGFTVVATDRP